MMMENIHSETYSLLIDTYISDAVQKDFLLKATQNIPVVTKKADWANTYRIHGAPSTRNRAKPLP